MRVHRTKLASTSRLSLLVGLGLFAAAPAVVQAQTAPSAHTSATRYDALGRVTGIIAPDPDGGGPLRFPAVRNTYDVAGRLIRVEKGELADWQSEFAEPVSWAGFTILTEVETDYDPMNRKTRETVRGSDRAVVSVTQYGYDQLGRLECTARRMNPAAYGSLPASACVLGPEGGFGPDRITRNGYDAAGQLLAVEEAVGTPIAKVEARYTYSPNGKRTSLTDARGYTATMTYDGHDRLQQWNLPSPTTPGVASPSDYESYGYDANGNRTSLRKRDGSVLGFQYDALNRVTAKIVPERAGLSPTHTRDVYYGYDLRGLQTYARFDAPWGEGVTNSWDGFGRQASTTLAMDGQSRTLTSRYNPNGNRTLLIYPDGASHVTYAYDGLNRQVALFENGGSQLTNVTYDRRGGANAFSRRMGDHTLYGYDPVGRLFSYTHNFVAGTGNVTTGLGYTPSSQIASESRSNGTYAWTGHANVDRGYAVNGLNQYTSAGSAAFGYDANGNLTSDGSNGYGYDVENRLVQVGGSRTAQLRYDPLGRLYETNGGSAGLTRFLYDGDELVAETGQGGQVLRQYVHGSGTDDPLVWYEGASFGTAAARYLYTDHHGSVIAVSGANGALATINSYDEYGIPGAGNQGRFQYTGQAWLPEVGLYHYKARVYSPTLGRFLQVDPIGYGGGQNLYAYVGNDPISGRDPAGLLRCEASTDSRCQQIHADATIARAALINAAAEIKQLRKDIKEGSALSAGQASLKGFVEAKFGSRGSSQTGLRDIGRVFATAARKIGDEGRGNSVVFSPSSGSRAAEAPIGGNTIKIFPSYFTPGFGPRALLHEGVHSAGIDDQVLNPLAGALGIPANYPDRTVQVNLAYGNSATNWLGSHQHEAAENNADSYTCIVLSIPCGQ